MARQRLGEFRRDGPRRRRGLVLLAALTLVVAGCDSGAVIFGGGTTGGGGGGGGSGGGVAADSLLGTWRNVFSVQTTDGDVEVVDTRWTFSGGPCAKTVLHTFVNAGVGDSSTTPCTYTFNGTQITVTFLDTMASQTFSVALSAGELLLDGTPFNRFA